MNAKKILVTIALVVASLTSFGQTIRYVKPTATGSGNGSSWTNASADIQAMVNASSSGDSIFVAQGVYTLTAALTMKEGVDVYGGFVGTESSLSQRPTLTFGETSSGLSSTIDANAKRRVLTQSSDFTTETLWDGFVLKNGYTSASGGGASLRAGGNLNNCNITNNTASTVGGGVLCHYGGTLTNCNITNNKSSEGGGVWSNFGSTLTNCNITNNTASSTAGGGVYFSDGTLTNCNIINNTASTYGGGIYCNSSSNLAICNITNCNIVNNTASTYGGGVYCKSGSTLTNCNIVNNMASSNGGGVYCYQGGILTNCNITNNKGSDGGGIYCNIGGILTNCNIANNMASSNGGGVSCYQGGILTNCNITNNMANSNGGGAHCTYGGVLTNCIVWRNKKAGVFEQIYATSGTLIIPKYCAVQDGYTGAGNINLDSTNTGTTSGKFYPYFVSPTTFTGVATNAGDSLIIANADWRIIGTSACVDKGIADTTGLNLPLIDLAENQRILNSRIDIGSYEFNGLLQTITWTQSLADISMGLGNMELTAVASSDLPVAYVSDNLSVARVSNDTLYFLGPGTANITAKQEGNGMYFPATNVIKTINVLNNDATLSYLTVSESTLTPAFSSSITQYSINVCPDIISISITATANDINASFIGNITDYSLPATDTTFIINVIAEDGITIEDYKIDILHVPTYFIPLAVTICKGKFFSFGGNTLTTSGVYYDSLTTVNGCDSIIELTLTVIPSYFIPLAETICNGESFSFGGNSLTASGVYYDSLTTMNGCDSIYELTLMVNSVYEMLVSASITQGESYNFFDTNLTTAGEYKHTLQSIHGCDSVIILTLTITTSIIEVETNSTLQIYPNPTKGQLTMDNGQLTMEYVEIYDISGRKLQTIKVLETSKVLDVSHLANGIYLIKVKTKQGETMRKIVKKTNNE